MQGGDYADESLVEENDNTIILVATLIFYD